jgi:hypothetical protein
LLQIAAARRCGQQPLGGDDQNAATVLPDQVPQVIQQIAQASRNGF